MTMRFLGPQGSAVHVENAGTVYEVTLWFDQGETYILVADHMELHNGEWLRISSDFSDSIAWTYLTEKMPGLARFGGDKPGWIKAFAEAGIEVFG